jgi:hypothetical protein
MEGEREPGEVQLTQEGSRRSEWIAVTSAAEGTGTTCAGLTTI